MYSNNDFRYYKEDNYLAHYGIKGMKWKKRKTNGNMFNGTPNDLVIYVPEASLATYQSASGWSSFASKMQAIPG